MPASSRTTAPIISPYAPTSCSELLDAVLRLRHWLRHWSRGAVHNAVKREQRGLRCAVVRDEAEVLLEVVRIRARVAPRVPEQWTSERPRDPRAITGDQRVELESFGDRSG